MPESNPKSGTQSESLKDLKQRIVSRATFGRAIPRRAKKSWPPLSEMRPQRDPRTVRIGTEKNKCEDQSVFSVRNRKSAFANPRPLSAERSQSASVRISWPFNFRLKKTGPFLELGGRQC